MEFVWNIGLAPTVNLELSDKIEVEYHRIQVEDSVIDQQIEALSRRHGDMSNPDIVEEDDVLLCDLVELESEGVVKPEGHAHTANLFVKFVKNEEIKKQFIGKKIEDSIEMDLMKAFENETEAASIIAVKKEDFNNYGPLFRVTIKKISRLKPAELNEEFFEKVFPMKGIADEASFRKEIEGQLSLQYQAEVDRHFANEVSKTLIEEAKLELPEDFIKRWILDSPKNELTPEEVERDFSKYADSFRWQFIENHIIKTNGVEVGPEEVKEHVAGYIRGQFASYGAFEPDEEMVEKYTTDILKNKDELKKVYDTLFDQKLMALYKEKLKLKEVKMKFDDFVKMVEEKYKKDSD
jgi:trigger factor